MYPYVPYSSPYLLPWAPPAFLEGWGQDRVRGRHLTARYYYRGVVSAFGQFSRGGGGGGGGGGGAHVASNTEYFNVVLEVGGPWGCPRPTTPIPPLTYYYPYSSPYLLLPYSSPYLLCKYPYSSPYLLLLLPLPLPTTTPPPPLTYYYSSPSPYLLLLLPLPLPTSTLLLPLPTTTPTPPLTYYSPGAWSEVTSMVTYVMMTNSLIHYCQSMKHIYMDTVYKLS